MSTSTSAPEGPTDAQPAAQPEYSPFKLSGFVQVDYVRLDRSSDQLSDGDGTPLNEDRIFIRNGRLMVTGQWKYVGFGAEGDLDTINGPAVSVRRLYGTLQLPSVDSPDPLIQLTAGLFPVPFGFEMHLEGDNQRFFGERTLIAQAFVPGRFDVGVGLSGRYDVFVYSLAAQNGEPLGTSSFPGEDPNAAKDLSGRIGVDVELLSWLRVAGGVSALKGTGFSAGRPPTKDDFIWRDFNEDGQVSPSELQPVNGSAAAPSENFDRFAFGADLQLELKIPYLGLGRLYGEIVTGVNMDRLVAVSDPGLTGRDQRSSGYYVAYTQELFDVAIVGARYDVYEPDADETDQQGGTTVISRRPFETLTFGVAGLYGWDNIRARALAEVVIESNSLGRDDAGRPASVDNDVIRLRLEVVF